MILDFFPHTEVREGQDKLIKDIKEAFTNRNTLIAHAPTGLGKTASALSAAVQIAVENKKKVFFLTNRHTQHQIAVNTLKLMREKTGMNIICADLIGKRWMCSQEIAGVFGSDFNEFCKAVVEKGECEFYNNVRNKKSLTVEGKALLSELSKSGIMHNEELANIVRGRNMCSYEITLEIAKKADVVIGDYFYLFNPFIMNTMLNKLNIEMEDIILVVDEAHNLPKRITEMLSSNLTSNMLRNGVVEARKFGYKGIIFWLQEMMKVLAKLADFTGSREKLVSKCLFIEEIKNIQDYDELVNELELAADEVRKKQRKSYLGGIAAFLKSWKSEDKGFTRIIAEKKGKMGSLIVLSYSCLDPSMAAREIFNGMHCAMLMSGTLKPTSMYRDLLGIEKVMEKEYDSPFPLQNRLSLIVPETTTKYTLRGEEMYQKIAVKCSELVTLIPGNVALFFPSYELRDRICPSINSEKKKFWEKSELSKEEKETFLNSFRAEKNKGGILFGVTGANFAEGVDLPGNLLNGVIVVGLPLGKPDLKTQEVIKYYDEKFGKGWDYGYVFPAMSKCIQSAGRCIRSETDKGTIIYLDERFSWQNYFNCLPSEGLIVSKDYRKMLIEFWCQ